jgi:hypothetical protein
MMKKLLVLALVLGIASLAPAALQLAVGGNVDPVDSEITLAPSEELVLGIDGVLAEPAGAYWIVAVNVAVGTVNGDAATTVGGLSRVNVGDYAYNTNYLLYYAGLASDFYGNSALSAVSGGLGDLGALSGMVVDGIVFHCEALGDAVVQLYTSATGGAGTWELEDSVVIHQVPEPATMALLGLGALVLRRKK